MTLTEGDYVRTLNGIGKVILIKETSVIIDFPYFGKTSTPYTSILKIINIEDYPEFLL